MELEVLPCLGCLRLINVDKHIREALQTDAAMCLLCFVSIPWPFVTILYQLRRDVAQLYRQVGEMDQALETLYRRLEALEQEV